MLKSILKRLKKKSFRDAYVRSHLSHGLAHQIQALRLERNWTQVELAKKLGLKTQSAVARMEDPAYGRLSIATLLKLSSVFDVALSVRFVSYGKFLLEREDVSPEAISAESFEEEMPRIICDLDNVAQCTSNSISYSQSRISSPSGITTGYIYATGAPIGELS